MKPPSAAALCPLNPKGPLPTQRPFLHVRKAQQMFSVRNLSVLAYANGFTLWHYKAARNRLAEVASNDFFNSAGDMLAPGDLMMVSASDGARVLSVMAKSEGGITIASMS